MVLRQRRIELGLKQSDFEGEESFDRSYMSKLELAKRSPDLRAIFHIAHVLRLDPHELIRRAEVLLESSTRKQ
jgi:transcriptional regulator with XRE-family HTH domain